jgi:hypothetical protein
VGVDGPWPVFYRFLVIKTVGKTPCAGDQPFVRSLPTHRTTQTEQTETDIRASSRIRNHDSSIRAGEDIRTLDRVAIVMGKVYVKDENPFIYLETPNKFMKRITNTQPPRDVWDVANILRRYRKN